MRAVVTIVIAAVILCGCGRSERAEGPAKLAELRTTIHGLYVGPGDYSSAPPEWRNFYTSQPCECGDVCRLETDYTHQMLVLTADTPGAPCGVRMYYVFFDDLPDLAARGLSAPVFELAGFSYEKVIEEYGPPTTMSHEGGFQVVYCTELDGAVMDISQTSQETEMISYGFLFNLRQLEGLIVHWKDKCDPIALPPMVHPLP